MDVLFATDFTTREVLFLVAVPFVALGIGASCFGIYGHLKDYIRPSLQRSPPLSVPNPLSESTRRINGGLNGIKKKKMEWRIQDSGFRMCLKFTCQVSFGIRVSRGKPGLGALETTWKKEAALSGDRINSWWDCGVELPGVTLTLGSVSPKILTGESLG